MLMLMLFVVDALLPGKGIVTCHVKSQGEVGQLVDQPQGEVYSVHQSP